MLITCTFSLSSPYTIISHKTSKAEEHDRDKLQTNRNEKDPFESVQSDQIVKEQENSLVEEGQVQGAEGEDVDGVIEDSDDELIWKVASKKYQEFQKTYGDLLDPSKWMGQYK